MIKHTTRVERAGIAVRMEACRCAMASVWPSTRVLSDATVLGCLSRAGPLGCVEIARNFRHPVADVRAQLQRLRAEGRVELADGRWSLSARQARRRMIVEARP